MRDRFSVARPAGWFVTAQGRYDLAHLPTCQCKPKLVGLLLECPDCGTVFGHMKDIGLPDSYGHVKTRRD